MVGQVEPIAKDITRGVIEPGAKALAENAVPLTKEVHSRPSFDTLSRCVIPNHARPMLPVITRKMHAAVPT